MDITDIFKEVLSTVSLLETLPLVVPDVWSTEATVSLAQPLSLVAPLLSYRNKLRLFSKMVVASKVNEHPQNNIRPNIQT